MTRNAHIVFTPSGRQGRVEIGTSILDAARTLGVDLDSVCGGRALCGRCQVEPTFGSFAKHNITADPSSLSPLSDDERAYQGRRPLPSHHRLGCMTRIKGDVVINVPAESQVHQQIVRKDVAMPAIQLDPAVRLYFLEVPEAELDSPVGEWTRTAEELASDWHLTNLTASLPAIAELQQTLGRSRAITVAVRDQTEFIASWTGLVDRVLGVAIDVGSTTLAGHLCDLNSGEVLATAGRMNPQIRFGEDLMSRVSYIMMNPEAASDLTDTIREALDDLLGELTGEADVPREAVFEITLVGNPVMHHLFLGLDSVPLGGSPFALATDTAVSVFATELGITAHRAARAYVLPCIAGHVGADTAAMILSEGPHRSAQTTLLVDIGTNAEIVIGNQDRLFAASSPTGPAFEGAQISCGQRATPGAIERVRIDRETLEPRFKIIGSDRWSDDPAFERETGHLTISGICGSGIIEVIAELYLAGILLTDGVIDPAAAKRCERVVPDGRTFAYLLHASEPPLLITQNDVRAIQLAKAALHAGIRLLLDHYLEDSAREDHNTNRKSPTSDQSGGQGIDVIRLAGAFGSHIDPIYALAIGLLPDCRVDRVTAAGNSAGAGALMALLSNQHRREIEAVARRVHKIETATEPKFQEHFVAAMSFPHASDPYSNLANVLDLPTRTDPKDTLGRRRPRRQRPGASHE